MIKIKSLCIDAFTYFRNLGDFKQDLENNLSLLKIQNKNVLTNLEVSFLRKNKLYEIDIFII